MDCTTLPDNGGRRSGSDRRTKIISLYADFQYNGTEKRQNSDRRSRNDRREHCRMKVSARA